MVRVCRGRNLPEVMLSQEETAVDLCRASSWQGMELRTVTAALTLYCQISSLAFPGQT